MAGSSIMSRAIIIAIALVVIAIILPIGLVYISEAGSTTIEFTQVINDSTGETGLVNKTLSDSADPAVLTLLTVLLPILVVIAIVMYFIPRMRD